MKFANFLIYIYAALIQLFILSTGFSLSSDRLKIATIKSNKADLNQSTHKGEFIGDVQFDQGTTHLRAKKVITESNFLNKVVLAIAYGDKDFPAHYYEQTSPDKPLLHAYANEIRYYPLRHLIELIGNARVVQGDDSFSATKITYDTQKQHIQAYGDKKNRTLIIVHPGKSS